MVSIDVDVEDSSMRTENVRRFYAAVAFTVLSALMVSALVAMMSGLRSGALIFAALLSTTLLLLVVDGARDLTERRKR